MGKSKKAWVYSPPKPTTPSLSDSLKQEVQHKADELIEFFLKSKYIKAPPETEQFNYLVDISGRWYRNYFYFCSKYNCPSANALSPSFDDKFARMEHIGNNKFNLSYMRHTTQWWEIHQNLSLEECFECIKNEPHFMP